MALRRFKSYRLHWEITQFLPTAVSPCQVMQFEHTEDQRDSRHSHHEHYEDIFLCWPGDVTVHWMWTRPGLRQMTGVSIWLYVWTSCFILKIYSTKLWFLVLPCRHTENGGRFHTESTGETETPPVYGGPITVSCIHLLMSCTVVEQILRDKQQT